MSDSAKKPPEPGRPKKRSSERIQGLFEGLDRLPSAPPGDGQSERVKPRPQASLTPTPTVAVKPPSATPPIPPPPEPKGLPPSAPAPAKEAAPFETPPAPPSIGKELVILPLPQQGVASQEGDLTQPAGQTLTPLPYESLKQGPSPSQPAPNNPQYWLTENSSAGRQLNLRQRCKHCCWKCWMKMPSATGATMNCC